MSDQSKDINEKGKPFTILFRTDANSQIGYGHLSRCLRLAKVHKYMGGRAAFLFGEITSEVTESRMDGFPFYVMPQGISLQDETAYIERNILTLPDAIVLDVAHSAIRGNSSEVETLLLRLSERFSPISLIDAAGTQSLRENFVSLPVHFVIAPYVGEKNATSSLPYRLLAGPEYFIFDKEYHGVFERTIRKNADRILVTCGGADPANITLKILAALSKLSFPVLSVRVAVGPMFPNSLAMNIRKLAETMAHHIEILSAPASLFPHIQWCDFAIATSGLTKYELAATGTPSILMSPDVEHAKVNLPFAALGTAKDLGFDGTVSSKRLAEEIKALIQNQRARKVMAANGEKTLDGNGAFRILDELRRFSDA